MSADSVIRYVRNSSVRTEVVEAVSAAATTTETLLAEVDASESAVYGALSDLEERGLLTSVDDGWQLSGTGRVVADVIRRQRRFEDVLAADEAYWHRHDVAALPRPFRSRLTELSGYTVVRGTQTDVDRPVREVTRRVGSVDSCDAILPVYRREYQTAMPDTPDARLVLSADVVENILNAESVSFAADTFEATAVRVTRVAYALVVAEDWTLLTLPETDGSWPTATLVSETDDAVRWGRDLFTHVWTDATPIEAYLSQR